MNDFDALERLMYRIDQALNQEREVRDAEVNDHLDSCDDCIAEIERVRLLRQLLQSSCACEAPESLRERVRVSYQEISVRVTRYE